jgi:hypothetical protein
MLASISPRLRNIASVMLEAKQPAFRLQQLVCVGVVDDGDGHQNAHVLIATVAVLSSAMHCFDPMHRHTIRSRCFHRSFDRYLPNGLAIVSCPSVPCKARPPNRCVMLLVVLVLALPQAEHGCMDQAEKVLFELHDGHRIEAVYMSYVKPNTTPTWYWH